MARAAANYRRCKKTILSPVPRGGCMAGMEFAETTLPGTEGVDFTRNTESDFSYLGSGGKGFNVINIPILWERMQPTLNAALDSTYKGYLDQDITWANTHGMKVIIKLQNFGRRRVSGTNYTIGGGTVDENDFADFWDRMSTEYSANTTVIAYDLMNEPHDMPTPTTSANYSTTATATVMYQAAVDAIRLNGDTTYCVVELDQWANTHAFVSNYGSNPDPWITDSESKIIYSGHYYFDSDHSGQYSGDWDSTDRFDNVRTEVEPFLQWCKNKSVIGYIGEYGTPNDDPRWLDSLDMLLRLCDEYDAWATQWASGVWYNSPSTLHPGNSYNNDQKQMWVVEKHTGTADFTNPH